MNFLTFVSGDDRKSPETGRQVLDNSTSALRSQTFAPSKSAFRKQRRFFSCVKNDRRQWEKHLLLIQTVN